MTHAVRAYVGGLRRVDVLALLQQNAETEFAVGDAAAIIVRPVGPVSNPPQAFDYSP